MKRHSNTFGDVFVEVTTGKHGSDQLWNLPKSSQRTDGAAADRSLVFLKKRNVRMPYDAIYPKAIPFKVRGLCVNDPPNGR